jgi:hypothetical protein
MPATAPLRQKTPGAACGRSHNWSGAVVAKAAPAATEAKAKSDAVNVAKPEATTYYNDDKNRKCPTTPTSCPSSGTAAVAPQSKPDLQFAVQDPATQKWTGYAVVFWTFKRTCSGQGQPEAMALPAPTSAAVTVPEDVQSLQPQCGTRIAYSGAVIAQAFDPDLPRAQERARETAKAKADALVATFRQKTCPDNCQPGTGTGSVRPAVDVTHTALLQVTNAPYVAYAAAFFDAALECPPAAGGGGGGGLGGGGDFRRR